MPTVYIIIYSLYHHIYKVAKDVQKGLESEGVTVKLFQVPETLSDEILEKLHAPPKPDIPVITVDALTEADAFLFGVPTRFGTFPAQMKSFLDATGALWATGALSGKFVGTFFSTASQHGGQETTAYTLLTYFAHHGLNYVPLGFANSNLFDNTEVVGGSPYGAGTVANGDGSREPTVKELEIAHTQGENFAKLLNTFHRGLGLADDKQVEDVQKVEDKQSNDVIEEAAPVTATTATTTAPTAAVAATEANEAAVAPASATPAAETTTTSREVPAATSATTEEPSIKEVEPVPAKEEPKSESKPKVEEEKKPATASKPAAPKTTPKKEEKKESKCFCM
ncbi:unnamed protein product [Mucor circinelloides]|uniref:Trp repressor binding protein n=1 Tax=Mucor circinelloides f. circinelloides (strain 1006PhL) TaxID=1220926 RepID=S2K5G2_MUCC1|nr:Trp repressor binding protein [Mucor circinelloides 1006PhL]KAG1123920.1 hypothetical protein G6F42_010104 [Rhizopus arrhizus]